MCTSAIGLSSRQSDGPPRLHQVACIPTGATGQAQAPGGAAALGIGSTSRSVSSQNALLVSRGLCGVGGDAGRDQGAHGVPSAANRVRSHPPESTRGPGPAVWCPGVEPRAAMPPSCAAAPTVPRIAADGRGAGRVAPRRMSQPHVSRSTAPSAAHCAHYSSTISVFAGFCSCCFFFFLRPFGFFFFDACTPHPGDNAAHVC